MRINRNIQRTDNSCSVMLEHRAGRDRSPKKAKLGRYDRIKRELETNILDERKVYVPVPTGCDCRDEVFSFVDLFCGAGGISCGLERAGFRSIASVEIIEVASRTYKRNFPHCRHFCGDVAEFNPTEWLGEETVKTVDMVVGGPPCQGFSVAGRRDPNDPRNVLFREFVRVVQEVEPLYVVMENVPGILTMKGGEVRERIVEEFARIGYQGMSVGILESADYGIPQIRPRAIFVANRCGLANPYPAAQLKPEQYIAIESAISDLPQYETIPEINHEWTRHSKAYMDRIASVPPGGSLYASYFDAFKRQYPGLPSMTVKENHGGTHIHPYLNRVISAREMARLQTFPDDFIFEGSMKKAMWQIGNAVPPRLAEVIGLVLRPYLKQARSAIGRPLFCCSG